MSITYRKWSILNALISNSKNFEGFSYENELMDIISESSDKIEEFEKNT